MSTYSGAFRAGNFLWIARAGVQIDTGVFVDENHKPDWSTSSALWTKIRSVIDVDVDPEEEEISAQAPNEEALLEDYETDIIAVKMKYSFELESYDNIIHEILFRTTMAVDGTYKRGSTPVQKGWMHWQCVNKYGETVHLAEEWGTFKVTGDKKFSPKQFMKPTLEFNALQSNIKAAQFVPGGIPTV